jgi:DNA-binding Lrp family transcriptional regulator
MARKPKSYTQLSAEVEMAEAKLKSLKELQAQARKQEQSKLAERIGKLVIKAFPDADFIAMSDEEIIATIKQPRTTAVLKEIDNQLVSNVQETVTGV